MKRGLTAAPRSSGSFSSVIANSLCSHAKGGGAGVYLYSLTIALAGTEYCA